MNTSHEDSDWFLYFWETEKVHIFSCLASLRRWKDDRFDSFNMALVINYLYLYTICAILTLSVSLLTQMNSWKTDENRGLYWPTELILKKLKASFELNPAVGIFTTWYWLNKILCFWWFLTPLLNWVWFSISYLLLSIYSFYMTQIKLIKRIWYWPYRMDHMK